MLQADRPCCVRQVAAGLTTGALAIMIASPTDLVKVRMQAEQGGQKPRYPNARAAYPMIIRQLFLLLNLPLSCALHTPEIRQPY